MAYIQGLGRHEERIAQDAIRSGMKIPDEIINAPVLSESDVFYVQSFYELDSERSFGEVPGPIPRSKIVEYGKEVGLSGDDLEDFIYLVRAIDVGHMDSINKKQLQKGEN